MVLKSLTVINGLGWLLGIVPLEVPYGELRFKGWKNLITLYAVVLHVGNTLFWLDMYTALGVFDLTNLSLDGLFRKAIQGVTLFVYTYTKAYLRWKGQQLVRLMQNLDMYQKRHSIQLKMPSTWPFILSCVLALHFTVATVLPMNLGSIPPYQQRSTVYLYLPSWARIAVTIGFGSIPELTSTIIPISYVVILIHHLVALFEAMCHRIQLCNGSNTVSGQLSKKTESADFRQLGGDESWDFTRADFYKFTSCFDSFDEIFGPILASLFLLSTATIVSTIANIAASKLTLAGAIFSLTNLLVNLAILGLTEVGNWAHTKIDKLRNELHRFVRERARARWYSKLTIDHVDEVEQCSREWGWKFTAADYFIIDRSLVPGILSSSLAMIVILFQLQAAVLISNRQQESSLAGTTEAYQ